MTGPDDTVNRENHRSTASGGGNETVVVDGETTWVVDTDFLRSNWTCLWGNGCPGIEDRPAPELGLGCCSVGAHLVDPDEALRLSALADTIDPARFQHHQVARDTGIYLDGERTNTALVDGACIFLNRPGFPGGAGCALHLEAAASGEAPQDWKPAVCWQLPLAVDWDDRDDGTTVAHLRAWRRSDWGEDGETMAWCCTEDDLAFQGDRPVIDSLANEISALTGPAVFVELRRRLGQPDG